MAAEPGSKYTFSHEGATLGLRKPTRRDQRRWFSVLRKLGSGQEALPLDELLESDEFCSKVVQDCLLSVEGIEDDAGRPIETVSDFIEHAPINTFYAVIAEILQDSILTTNGKKNSAKPTDSSPAETPPSRGTAPSAEPKDLPRSATASNPTPTPAFDTSQA